MYLAVLAGCLLCAIWLEPVLHVGVLRQRRRLLRTIAPVFVIFVTIDIIALSNDWWTVSGLLPGLPFEELLFFVVVPLCAILGFEAVRKVLRR